MAHLFAIGDEVSFYDLSARRIVFGTIAAQHDDERVVIEFNDDNEIVVVNELNVRPADDIDELEYIADSGTWR